MNSDVNTASEPSPAQKKNGSLIVYTVKILLLIKNIYALMFANQSARHKKVPNHLLPSHLNPACCQAVLWGELYKPTCHLQTHSHS